MVEHLVEDDPQAVTVQAADHGAELGDLRSTVGLRCRRRVRALGGVEVPRVVAPVEGVLAAHLLDAGLLLLAVRGVRRQVAVGCGLLGGSSSIEAMSKVGSRCTVFRPASARALRCWCRRRPQRTPGRSRGSPRSRSCPDGEVAHVQLVDRGVHVVRQLRRRRRAPQLGLEGPSPRSTATERVEFRVSATE